MIVNSISNFRAPRAVNFGSKNLAQTASNVVETAVEKVAPKANSGMFKKVALPLALAATVLGGALLTGCSGGGDEEVSPITPTDPTDPTNPTNVFSESQKAIMNSLLTTVYASNAIIIEDNNNNPSIQSSMSLDAEGKIVTLGGTTDTKVAKNISYSGPDDFTYNLSLDEEKLKTNPDVIEYKGTKKDNKYGDITQITRTYYKTDDSNVVKYKDSDDSAMFIERQDDDHFNVYLNNSDNFIGKKTPTSKQGEMIYTNSYDETIGLGYFKDYTVEVK